MKLFLIILCLGFLLLSVADAQTARRPNIVFILADDMGYRDLSVFGQQARQTPNLDKQHPLPLQQRANGMTPLPGPS